MRGTRHMAFSLTKLLVDHGLTVYCGIMLPPGEDRAVFFEKAVGRFARTSHFYAVSNPRLIITPSHPYRLRLDIAH